MEWIDNPEHSSDFYFYLISSCGIFLFLFAIFMYGWYNKSFYQKIGLIGILIFVGFIGFVFSWKWYLADYCTPKKLRWDEEGIEMINVFDKRVKIPWEYIVTVKYYREKIFGKWEEAYYVRYRIPDLSIFKQNRFWVSTDIGEELYAYWAKIKAKQEWGADKKI